MSKSSASASSSKVAGWSLLGAGLIAAGLAARYFLGKPIKTQGNQAKQQEGKGGSDSNQVSVAFAPKALPTVVEKPHVFKYGLSKSLQQSQAQLNLYAAIARHERATMASSPDESQFLAWLAATTKAKRVVEVGVFMGSTTLAIAQALPADGKIHALDVDADFTAFGVAAWAEAKVSHKVDLRLAPAQASLQKLCDEGLEGTVDLAFIDANKTGYDTYYEYCLRLLRKGGIVCIDNVYWHGAVAESDKQDADTLAIRAINDKLFKDTRVSIALIPIADGLTLATKL